MPLQAFVFRPVGSYGRSSNNEPPVFSIVVITFYIPTKVHKGSNFHTYILNNTLIFFLPFEKISSHPNDQDFICLLLYVVGVCIKFKV